jgi:hypothetical protein
MPEHETHDVHHKALSLNLDPSKFGSFAEIGAGQEVARWFLSVGGASGTVAKTISAYDKEVSDDLYGAGTRYVSKPRLQAMLESEWKQLLAELEKTRGARTRFFTFVDTISARNFAGTNDCHGWVGLRFQLQPSEPPNDLILHINLMDPTNIQQQEAVGILGVNLIYAAYHALGSPEDFLHSIFEELGLQRMEIDCLEWKGPVFADWKRDEVHASLVVGGYAEAVAFLADDQLLPPNELLYKRALALAAASFDNVRDLSAGLIEDTLAQLPEDELKESKGSLGLFCLSIASLSAPDRQASVKETLSQVRELQLLGYGVMLFRAPELYKMSAFANRYTKLRIYFAVGLAVHVRVVRNRYLELPGLQLEGLARLFMQNVRLVVYPMTAEELQSLVEKAGLTGWSWKETDGVVSVDNLHPPGPLDSMQQYLLKSGYVLAGKPEKAVPISPVFQSGVER